MNFKVSHITENKFYRQNQEQILQEIFLKNRVPKKQVFKETLKGFREDKPELSEEELEKITKSFLEKIEIVLK